jgi:uncharacterized membrane protein YphA (DoxX/SURF4 family)
MKTALNIARILVGVLFIFSGLIKANDPLGLAYKMQEFFEVLNLHFMNDWALFFSLFMNGFEILAGVAILIGWRPKMFSWLLLLLIIFFTFLTGFALFSGKIKTCGCFGDCIPLTPAMSFIKDLILFGLILFIVVNQHKIKQVFSKGLTRLIVVITILFCFVLQWYALNHLPVVDCLPYKVGNNIVEKMKIPEGALPDSFAINFKYLKNGNEVEFDMDHFPEDFNDTDYTFVDRYQKLVRPGTAVAPISDFSLRTPAGKDTTIEVLNIGNYVMLMVKDANMAEKDWADRAAKVAAICKQKDMPFFVVTATLDAAKAQLLGNDYISFLICDATVIKTIARVNPTYLVMQQANIKHKYANADYEKVLEALKNYP